MDIDPVDAIVVAGLSAAATAAVGFTDLGVGAVVAGDLAALARSVAVLLVVLPLPIAYVVTISMERFRIESLASAVSLLFGFRGVTYATIAAGITIASLIVSYKTRSIFHGDNRFWTRFKASASTVTILAIVIGLAAALTYQGSADFRQDLRGNATNVTTELAVDQVGAVQETFAEQQRQVLVNTAGLVAENSSTAAIALTEQNVFTAVQQDGSFSASQQQLLRDTFTTSRQDIPPRIRDDITTRVDEQLTRQTDGGIVETQSLEDRIATQVRQMLQRLGQPTTPVLAAIFVMALSIVLLFKIPFGLVAAVYASLLGGFRARFESTSEADAAAEERPDEA